MSITVIYDISTFTFFTYMYKNKVCVFTCMHLCMCMCVYCTWLHILTYSWRLTLDDFLYSPLYFWNQHNTECNIYCFGQIDHLS